MNDIAKRILECIKEVFPNTLKTAVWIIKITVIVSFVMLILRYTNILPLVSDLMAPVFSIFGLEGETALVFVSGYFVNVYSAIAVADTLDLSARSMTILGVMILCAHSMILETAVQKKSGSSAIRMVVIRTLSAIILGVVLNLILPGRESEMTSSTVAKIENPQFWLMLKEWVWSTFLLIAKMLLLIFSLTIIQRVLAEFGVIKYISRFLKPVMKVSGLPEKCAFLWIVANILGLAYGAAAMMDESQRSTLSDRDVDLLNTHIGIFHSNFEDLILISSLGAIWWILLISRWIMATILVWAYRLELLIRKK